MRCRRRTTRHAAPGLAAPPRPATGPPMCPPAHHLVGRAPAALWFPACSHRANLLFNCCTISLHNSLIKQCHFRVKYHRRHGFFGVCITPPCRGRLQSSLGRRGTRGAPRAVEESCCRRSGEAPRAAAARPCRRRAARIAPGWMQAYKLQHACAQMFATRGVYMSRWKV